MTLVAYHLMETPNEMVRDFTMIAKAIYKECTFCCLRMPHGLERRIVVLPGVCLASSTFPHVCNSSTGCLTK